jgi:lipopolysaccharide transport protein LptA
MSLETKSLLLAAAWLTAPFTWAAAPPKVTGPITITAKSGEWQNDVMIYTGDVVMVSKTLEIHGDRMELHQTGGKKGPYEITVTGTPATMKHLGELPGDPVTNGRGSKLVYRSGKQEIELIGNAHLDRGKDELNGEVVNYLVPDRRVQASGGAKGQVRIVLDVEEAQAEQKKKKDSTP